MNINFSVLKILYGDYMTLPHVEERQIHATFIKTNLELGNLGYSLNIESCKKKKYNLKLTTTVFSRNQNQDSHLDYL